MKSLAILLFASTCFIQAALAEAESFTGTWSVEVCDSDVSPCGEALFQLVQVGNTICGDHAFYPAGARRLNDGFPGSVRGAVNSDVASLEVTSGRNMEIQAGEARLKGESMEWRVLRVLRPGEADAALIYAKGTLHRVSSKVPIGVSEVCSAPSNHSLQARPP